MTVSAVTEADAWAPTLLSASAPQASLGSSVNLVGARGWGRVPCFAVLEHPHNQSMNSSNSYGVGGPRSTP